MSNATDNPKIQVLKAGGSGVFTNYIYKAIPLAFDESMSYYETLVGLRDYLEETVIPTVNNNAEAVAELQSLYEELNKYVDDYFKNLDVQEEINNKLDEMAQDGSLTTLLKRYIDPIQEAYETRIDNKIEQLEDDFSIVQDKVSSVTSGGPAGVYPTIAALQQADPDHTRIYLVEADGEWYYYNNNTKQWENGGVYLSQPIAKNQIKLYHLDSLLQKNLSARFTPVELEFVSDSYVQRNTITNKANIVASNSWKLYKATLTAGQIYQIISYNINLYLGMSVVDDEDNIIYSNNAVVGETNYYNDILMFNEDYTVYITANQTNTYNFPNNSNKIGVLSSIETVPEYAEKSLFNYEKTTPTVDTIQGYYLGVTSVGTLIPLNPNANYSVKRIKVYKNHNYYVHNKQRLNNSTAYCLTNLNGICTYTKANVGNAEYSEVIIPNEDGYIVLNDYPDFTYEIYELINLISPYKNKKISFIGDSITIGNGLGTGGFPKTIQEEIGCSIQNLGVSGSRIAMVSTGNSIQNQLSQIDTDCDVIVVEGGTNDYSSNVPLGQIQTTGTGLFKTELDNTTFYGGLETIFRYIYANHPTKPVVYVIIHSVNERNYVNNSIGLNFSNYIEAIEVACNKYGIDIVNLSKDGKFNTYFEDLKQYTNNQDGLHPTLEGYRKFYNKPIINEINRFISVK